MTAYLVTVETGAYDDTAYQSLCYCPTLEIAEKAKSLLEEDFGAAAAEFEPAYRNGTAFSGDFPLADRVIPVRVASTPMNYLSLRQGYLLVVEEVPSWEEEL